MLVRLVVQSMGASVLFLEQWIWWWRAALAARIQCSGLRDMRRGGASRVEDKLKVVLQAVPFCDVLRF